MKNIVIFGVLFVLLFSLTGCNAGRNVLEEYPLLQYRNSAYNFDPYNREIPIEDGYMLSEGHSYDIVKTEEGYDIILHFEVVE